METSRKKTCVSGERGLRAGVGIGVAWVGVGVEVELGIGVAWVGVAVEVGVGVGVIEPPTVLTGSWPIHPQNLQYPPAAAIQPGDALR